MSARWMLLAVLLCPALAVADSHGSEPSEPDYSRRGFFVGFGMAVGSAQGLEEDWEAIVGSDEPRIDAAVGYHVRAGYRIFSRLAVEAEFEWIPGFDVKLLNDVKLTDTQSWLLSGNAKGYLLADTRVQPFVLVGLGYYRNHGKLNIGQPLFPGGTHYRTQDDLAVRLGGGFDGYLTEHVVLGFDVNYVLGTGQVDDLSYLSIGVDMQYRF